MISSASVCTMSADYPRLGLHPRPLSRSRRRDERGEIAATLPLSCGCFSHGRGEGVQWTPEGVRAKLPNLPIASLAA